MKEKQESLQKSEMHSDSLAMKLREAYSIAFGCQAALSDRHRISSIGRRPYGRRRKSGCAMARTRP